MYQDFAVQCTWEGDNTVLMLQTGRYLVNCYKQSKMGKKMPPGVSYLNENDIIKFDSTDIGLTEISKAFDLVRSKVVHELGEHFESLINAGVNDIDAYEQCCKQN